MYTKEQLFDGFTIGEWEILPGQGVLRRDEREERPEPKVFAVLVSLARHDGNLVTRDQLIADVWEGRATSDEPINRALSQLRGHLDDRKLPHRYIETLQRRGYRLMQPVVLHQSAPSSGPQIERSVGLGFRTGKIVAALLALAIVITVVLTVRPTEPDPRVRSLAILPIENLSGDLSNQYIVDGIKNVLAQRLSGIPGTVVKNMRVSYDGEPSQIAERLDVDSVLSGAVQMQGSALKVTYLVTRGRDNVTVAAGEVDGTLDGIFSLQERLARMVRSELSARATPELISTHTPNSSAYNSYMRGIYALEHRGEADNLETAIRLLRESIRRDPDFGPSYLALATAYAVLPYYRDVPVEETDRAAIETVDRGIDVDASIRDAAAAIYGSVYHKQKRWVDAETAYRRAISADTVDSNAFNWYSRMLASVGRLDDALMQALAAEAIDPDNGVINSRVAIVQTWLGNSAEAHEFFQRANSLGGKGATHMLAYALLLIQDGRIEEAEKMALSGTTMAGMNTGWIAPVFAAFADPGLAGPALGALDDAALGKPLGPMVQVTARTLLGDVDGAMQVAQVLEEPGEWFQMDLLFAPQLQALRDHKEFMPLLERLGVVGYWRQQGCRYDGRMATCVFD